MLPAACRSYTADYEEIAAALAAVGAAARAAHQRLTAHPSHFVQLASPDPALVARSIRDLELNARVRAGKRAAGPTPCPPAARLPAPAEAVLLLKLYCAAAVLRQGSKAAGLMVASLRAAVLCRAMPAAPAVPAVQVFDLMGYSPSHWNKINIHVGAVHGGSKAAALQRFAAAVERLSPGCRARLTGAWVLHRAVWGLPWACAWLGCAC